MYRGLLTGDGIAAAEQVRVPGQAGRRLEAVHDRVSHAAADDVHRSSYGGSDTSCSRRLLRYERGRGAATDRVVVREVW
jgi:hypothetical protein